MTNEAREQKQEGMTRREFLRLAGAAAGGAVIGAAVMRGITIAPEPIVVTKEVVQEVPVTPTPGPAPTPAPAAAPAFTTSLPYPRLKVANIKDLEPGKPFKATYPDKKSPIYVIKFGRPVVGGVGPDQDIVAFSRLCPHMGCVMKQFLPDEGTLICGCHYSKFDLTKGGLMVIGQATDNLPQVELEYDEATGDIYAVRVHGLIYGRLVNVLPTEQAEG